MRSAAGGTSPSPTVAIVGSGVSGLSAGIALARHGFAVDVYEAGDKAGGACANTRVDGFTFHDGAVYLPLPRLLDAAFERIGLDRAGLLPLRPIDAGYHALLEDGRAVSAIRGRVAVTAPDGRSLRSFGGEVERFLARWRPLASLFTDDLLLRPPSPWRLVRLGGRHILKLRGTVAAEVRRGFSDEAVQSALAGLLLYAGMPPDGLPAVSVMGLFALLDEGFYLPVGGMGRIPEVLADALVARGGRLHLGMRVERIVVEHGRACGVEVAGQGRVAAGSVLSAVTAMATFSHLVAPDHVPRGLRRKVERSPLSHTAVSVQLGLRNGIEPRGINAILPMMSRQHRVLSGEENERWLNWSVPTATVPELAPPGGAIVEMFCPVRRGTTTDRAHDDAQANGVIDALARLHPLDIAVRRVRGPAHFQERMHLYRGALYGLSPAAGPLAFFDHRTPIRGLFQAGQTTYPGYGVSPAILSGILAAERIVAEQAGR